jgi:hypothetical protein
MSSNSLNFKGLQDGKSLEAQCFPSQSVNSKNPQKERDLPYNKARWRSLQVFLGILIMSHAIDSFSQTQAPRVDWRRFDWGPQIPNYPQFDNPGQPVYNKEDSGSDWWYAHCNSFSGGYDQLNENGIGNIDGIIGAGYSSYRGVWNEPNNGCYYYNPHIECNEFNDIGGDHGDYLETIAKIATDGHSYDWFKTFNVGYFNQVKPTSDGGFIAVGATPSTITFDGQRIIYNPDGSNTYFACATPDGPDGSTGRPSIVKVDHNGNTVFNYIYGLQDWNGYAADPTNNGDLWNIIELPNGNFLAAGNSNANDGLGGKACLFHIDANGLLLNRFDVSTNNAIASTGVVSSSCHAVNYYYDSFNQLQIVIGCIETHEVSGVHQKVRLYILAKNFNDLINNVPSPGWEIRYNANVSLPYPFGYDTQTIYNIIKKGDGKLIASTFRNCDYCLAGGNQTGEGHLLIIDPILGSVNYDINIGQCGSFDLRLGLTKTSDGGFACVTSKPSVTTNPTWLPLQACGPYGVPDPDNPGVLLNSERYEPYWNCDTYIAKFDVLGNMLWEGIYPDEEVETPPTNFPGNLKKQECMYSITEMEDGGLLAAGNNGANFDDNYMIKLHSDCVSRTNYDITSNAVSIHGIPYYEITGNETWNTHLKVKGLVQVKAGGVLTIESGAKIEFADSKKQNLACRLEVLPGGKLIIKDNAVLTALESCPNTMWDGIAVYGNPTLPQNGTNQGWVTMNTGTIKNARYGIIAGNYEYITSHGGGIVQCIDAQFINNYHDVDLLWYKNYNKSSFNRCLFTATDKLQDLNTPSFDDPHDYNQTHLHLWNVAGIKILDCTFKTDLANADASNFQQSIGIKAFDASFQVAHLSSNTGLQNTFENLITGVQTSAYNFNPSHPIINGAQFNYCNRGILAEATLSGSFLNNHFEMQKLSPFVAVPKGVAIFTVGASGLIIKDNLISTGNNINAYYGIVNTETGYGGAEVLRNSINEIRIGNQFEDDNTKLKADCNEFTNTSTDYFNWTVFGALADQGDCGGGLPTDPADPAANVFATTDCMPGGTTHQIALNGSGTNPFYYYYYDAPGTISSIIPNFDCIDPALVSTVVGCTNSSAITLEEACPANTNCNPCNFAQMMQQINAIEDETAALKRKIDNDKTEDVLTAMQNSSATQAITLVTDSLRQYLSEEVLLRYLRAPVTDWNEFKNTMIKNSPLQPKVAQLYDSIFVPSAIRILIAQAAAPISRYQILLNEISKLEIKQQQISNTLVNAYLDSASHDSAIWVLKNQHTISAAVQLLPYLVANSDNDLETYTELLENEALHLKRISISEDKAQNLYQMIEFYNWLNAVKNSNTPLNKLTSEKEDLLAFAETYPASQTSFMAQSLLQIINGNKYDRIPKVLYQFSDGNRSAQATQSPIAHKPIVFDAKIKLLSASPNPFSNQTTINYTLAENTKAELMVVEMATGKVIKRATVLADASQTYTLSNEGLSPGVYAIQMFINAQLINAIKVVYIQ